MCDVEEVWNLFLGRGCVSGFCLVLLDLPSVSSDKDDCLGAAGALAHFSPMTISFFFSGTRIPTTDSLITTRAIVSCILISPFTSSDPRCLGSCGTSFRKSPQRRFSQIPHPLGCSVSPHLGKDLSCLFPGGVSFLWGLTHSFIHSFVHSPDS